MELKDKEAEKRILESRNTYLEEVIERQKQRNRFAQGQTRPGAAPGPVNC